MAFYKLNLLRVGEKILKSGAMNLSTEPEVNFYC